MNLMALNNRYGLFSITLKAIAGLKPMLVQDIFSSPKASMEINIYRTRLCISVKDVLSTDKKYEDIVFDSWWENIANWEKHRLDFMNEVTRNIDFATFNRSKISVIDALEIIDDIVNSMKCNTDLQEVSIIVENKDTLLLRFVKETKQFVLELNMRD